jgi:hypothetical protein
MTSMRSFRWCWLILCVVAALLFGGCAGGAPGGSDQGNQLAQTMKVVVVSFGDSPYAQARRREVEALLRSSAKGTSIEYVTADELAGNVDSEERAVEAGSAASAGIVVWAKGVEAGSPELRMTVLATRGRPTITVSVPVEIAGVDSGGGPGSEEHVEEPLPKGVDSDNLDGAVEPLQGIVVPPNLGPLPAGPGAWDPKGQPVELHIGGEVHKNIALFYRSQHPFESVYTNHDSIAAIVEREKIPLPKGFTAEKAGLQPDIFNATKRHLYEIKSSSTAELIKGLGKLVAYSAALREAGFQVTRGPAGEPGTAGLVSAPGGYAYFTVVVPGLIVYRYTKSRPELSRLRVLEFAHEVLQRLEKANQPTPNTPPVLAPVPSMPPVLAPIPSTAPAPQAAPRRSPWDVPLLIYPATPIIPKGTLSVIGENLSKVKAEIAAITGLTGGALVVYLIISEGSRIFPPRNLIPLP